MVMKTYVVPQNLEKTLSDFFLKKHSDEEIKLNLTLNGCPCLELEEAKKMLNIGDFITVSYSGKTILMQCVHKYQDGRCVLWSHYVLGTHKFDDKDNDYTTSALRTWLNSSEFQSRFDKEFLDAIKTSDVSCGDKVVSDKFFIPSHEELGYKNSMLRNSSAITFDYFK